MRPAPRRPDGVAGGARHVSAPRAPERSASPRFWNGPRKGEATCSTYSSRRRLRASPRSFSDSRQERQALRPLDTPCFSRARASAWRSRLRTVVRTVWPAHKLQDAMMPMKRNRRDQNNAHRCLQCYSPCRIQAYRRLPRADRRRVKARRPPTAASPAALRVPRRQIRRSNDSTRPTVGQAMNAAPA